MKPSEAIGLARTTMAEAVHLSTNSCRLSSSIWARAAMCVAVMASTLPAVADEATFTGLGIPIGWDGTIARGISNDGSVVVGGAFRGPFSQPNQEGAFRWTRESGLALLEPSVGDSTAVRVAGDGAVIVGTAGGLPARWDDSGLFSLGTKDGIAYDTSADGQVIVGYSFREVGRAEAFRWTPGTGVVGLGVASPGGPGDARGVSADGAVVAGTFTGEAFRWTADAGIVPLGFLPTNSLPGASDQSAAYGISDDGSTIVGSSNGQAFRWTQSDGMVALGELAGGAFDGLARAASGDGSIIVGRSTTILGEEAFIWDETNGMRNLRDVLTDNYGLGEALEGWTLSFATEISDDGRFIVGTGIDPAGQRDGWLVDLGASPIPEPGAVSIFIIVAGLLATWRRGQQLRFGRQGTTSAPIARGPKGYWNSIPALSTRRFVRHFDDRWSCGAAAEEFA